MNHQERQDRFEKSMVSHDLQGWMRVGVNVVAVVSFFALLHFNVNELAKDLATTIDRMEATFNKLDQRMTNSFEQLRTELKNDRYKGADAKRDMEAVDLKFDAVQIRIDAIEKFCGYKRP